MVKTFNLVYQKDFYIYPLIFLKTQFSTKHSQINEKNGNNNRRN